MRRRMLTKTTQSCYFDNKSDGMFKKKERGNYMLSWVDPCFSGSHNVSEKKKEKKFHTVQKNIFHEDSKV